MAASASSAKAEATPSGTRSSSACDSSDVRPAPSPAACRTFRSVCAVTCIREPTPKSRCSAYTSSTMSHRPSSRSTAAAAAASCSALPTAGSESPAPSPASPPPRASLSRAECSALRDSAADSHAATSARALDASSAPAKRRAHLVVTHSRRVGGSRSASRSAAGRPVAAAS